jgi:hypothetical protein
MGDIIKSIILIISCIWIPGQMQAQAAKPVERITAQGYLPKVFLIGEYEQPYEQLIGEYDLLLMSAFNNDMKKAYEVWTTILIDMEEYAKLQQFDLNGLKLWINLFLNADGTIQHIVYYPKPNSRNMSFDNLTAFMLSFAKTYQLKDLVQAKCSHYGSASFPTFLKKN